MNGNKGMASVPSPRDLDRYSVNRPGAQEVIRQSLYDFQTYDTAGHSVLTFFQVPKGQSNKTQEDTNVEIAGSLPSPKRLLVESIEVFFYPGDAISAFGAGAASDFVNDTYNVLKSGFLRFFIGSKDYLIEGPLNRFPPKSGLDVTGAASDSTTAGADQAYSLAYAVAKGQPYRLSPPIAIPPTQNFSVTLEWPNGVVALNSANNARIGVVLGGLTYRLSQ